VATIVVNYAGSALAGNDPDFTGRSTGIDNSDYFLRHPELIQAAAVDTSDYALRHPELSRK
jgi:fructose-specific component phosphotransferase system IIB-like protein